MDDLYTLLDHKDCLYHIKEVPLRKLLMLFDCIKEVKSQIQNGSGEYISFFRVFKEQEALSSIQLAGQQAHTE